MKRKYFVTAIAVILCMAALGTAVYALAADKASGEPAEENLLEGQEEAGLPEEKIFRNEKGDMIGIDVTDEPVGMEYRSIDFKALLGTEQFKEYEKLGLDYDKDAEKLYFAGMEVRMLEDNYEDGVALQYIPENWDEAYKDSQVILTAVRDREYRLKYFEVARLSDESGENLEWAEGMDESGRNLEGTEEMDESGENLELTEEMDEDEEVGEELLPADETADSGNGMQELYNRSVIAKEYADQEFEKFLDAFDSDCRILETSYGFYTSEPPTYLAGYRYSNGVKDDLTYAYKISVDDEGMCKVLEEGAKTAGFLFEKQGSSGK